MLRFAVYNQSGLASDMPLRHAYLVGKEDLTVAGTIAFEGGIISCRKHTAEAAALGVQADLGPAGRLIVQTCLLPERDEPYNLFVELARHRLMLLLNKIEEWSLSDLPADHPVMTGFERVRDLFTQAISTPHDGTVETAVRISDLARQSLELGIETGERMTLLQAERDLPLRFAEPAPARNADRDDDDDGPGRPTLGCTLHPDQFAEPLQKIVARTFDFITVPMRWADIEREEGQRQFTPTDRWIEWAVRSANIPVVGGPLLDLSPRGVPHWLHIWENDYKTLRELAYEHLKAVITRYRRAIKRWIVVSGVHTNATLPLRMEEMIDLTRLAVLTLRKLQPKSRVLIEISHPFGEHTTHVDRALAPILYAGIVKESGIGFDGFAVRIQTGDCEPGRASRDLMQFSAMLDVMSAFDKPVHVSALGAPSGPVRPPASGVKHLELFGDPGCWRGPWTPARQADWLTAAITIAAGKPCVRSICWQSLWDSDISPEMRLGGLITADGKSKPALKRMTEAAAALRAGKPPSHLPPVEEDAPTPA